jgi:prepilin-type processing-associated H-X9-DG protein/prepilin-type N-terminal cleavage/methylation domain-containing protein
MIVFCFGFNLAGRKIFDRQKNYLKAGKNGKAFTLVELLVVISIISVLMGFLIAALSASREQARQVICGSNIRQLAMANCAYANENNGNYVLAASDILSNIKLHRWYGARDNTTDPYDNTKGPLAPYLKEVCLKCPTKVNFAEVEPSSKSYDQGAGGYGYNYIYIGTGIWKSGYNEKSCQITAKDTSIRKPSGTLMFADTAMHLDNSYIQYSFAEPRYFVFNGEAETEGGWDPWPSIHFRHRGKANIVWVDGHVSSEKMAGYFRQKNNVQPSDWDLGWFEPMDNSLFDLK